MNSTWDDEERSREWPIESLSAWAAAVVDRVEQSGGNAEAAYSSMYELADFLGMWEGSSTHAPGQVWAAADLKEMRRRFAHLMEPMRASISLVPEHPVWITLQLVDLLDEDAGLPALSFSEVARRTEYLRLLGTAERITRTQFDLDIASCEDVEPGERRPETPDEDPIGLFDTEHVRPRTFAELADDLREEAARSYLPERSVEELTVAASLAQRGETDAASQALERVVQGLYDAMAKLGDFRTRLQ